MVEVDTDRHALRLSRYAVNAYGVNSEERPAGSTDSLTSPGPYSSLVVMVYAYRQQEL